MDSNPNRESAIASVVESVNAFLDGTAGVIVTARALSGLCFALDAEWDEDFVTFRGIDSETDALPVGAVRESWALDALAREDAKIHAAEEAYFDAAWAAARDLLEKYAEALPGGLSSPPSRGDVLHVFDELAAGRVTRESAAAWAGALLDLIESPCGSAEPAFGDSALLDSLWDLRQAAETLDYPGQRGYMFSRAQFAVWRDELSAAPMSGGSAHGSGHT